MCASHLVCGPVHVGVHSSVCAFVQVCVRVYACMYLDILWLYLAKVGLEPDVFQRKGSPPKTTEPAVVVAARTATHKAHKPAASVSKPQSSRERTGREIDLISTTKRGLKSTGFPPPFGGTIPALFSAKISCCNMISTLKAS